MFRIGMCWTMFSEQCSTAVLHPPPTTLRPSTAVDVVCAWPHHHCAVGYIVIIITSLFPALKGRARLRSDARSTAPLRDHSWRWQTRKLFNANRCRTKTSVPSDKKGKGGLPGTEICSLAVNPGPGGSFRVSRFSFFERILAPVKLRQAAHTSTLRVD